MGNWLRKKALGTALLAAVLALLFGTGPARATETVSSSLGDFVWHDLDRDGVQDDGEDGIAGVTVNLYDCNNNYLQTAVTDANGYYLFTGLVAGSYSVEFVPPSGYVFTGQYMGTDDAADSDADPTTGKTACASLGPNVKNLTWDAGLVQPASLGDRVWLDANRNGVQDDGEDGIAGVTVNLTDCKGQFINSATTDVNGNYLFTDLDPGDYAVQFVAPAGYLFTGQNMGPNGAVDSDATNPVTDPSTGTTTATTACTTLAPGENDLTWDAGLVQPASLGNKVWHDQDKDGVQDAGEPGIEGAAVTLYACGSTEPLQTITTGADGTYLFANLTPGDYTVQFVAPPTSGYVFTTANKENIDDAADSDADRTTGTTACITLGAGENDMTWDAGLYLPSASLGDRVWHDTNKDGFQDAGEPGFAGVTVKLFDCSGKFIKETATDTNGTYHFTNLVPGSYAVQFVAPDGYQFSPSTASEASDPNDSDAVPTTDPAIGMTDCTTLEDGDNDMTWDAGLYLPGASLGDRVWLDTDKDGFQDGGESGLAGVMVKLTDCSGNVLYSTTTDLNGNYQFTDLTPGSYTVQFVAPAGYTFSPSTASEASDTNDSDADPTTGRTDCTTLEPGENDMTWDAGLYPPECGLVLEKTCEVESPPPGPFTCSSAKPIDSLSMQWNRDQIVNIKAWKGAVGSTLLATINGIKKDDEVTVSGFAGSPNDVYWEIFAADGTKIGHSIFHLSCSDVDMNGPEDCGKAAGNSKGVSGTINDWIFEGMAGNGQVLDCTPAPTAPSSQCVTQLGPVPDCTTAGKPTSLTFRYSGDGCTMSTNPQGGKAVCTTTPTQKDGIVGGDVTVRAAGNSSLTSDIYGVNPTSVPEGNEFTVTFNNSALKADSWVELVAANGVKELNKLHTSCSQPLRVGDRFGSLELVAFNNQTAGNDVVYTYTLTNNGAPLTNVTLIDDKLGTVAEGESILGNGTKTYELSAGLAGTVTNVATATGTLPDGNPQCTATAQAKVTVEVPQVPFVCAEAKPIDALSMVWNGSEPVRIKAWKGAVGSSSAPLADIDNILPGMEVTVTGFAGSPNDVYWEIFKAGTPEKEKIGTSVFHLSCSDADMNGAEDCGKYAGDSKGKVGFVNEWLFAGMAGNGKTLDCSTVTPPPPPDINVTQAAVPTVDKNKFYWRLTNNGTDTAVLTKVEVQAWPSQQGKLKKVKLDGDTAADPADIPWSVDGAVVSVFTADVKHKQIVAGQTRTFTLEFEKDYLLDTTADYQVTITFAGGETLSWPLNP